jgi:hypothetical protein
LQSLQVRHGVTCRLRNPILTEVLYSLVRQGSVGFGYTYSAKTSTSTLRVHLDKHHRKEYLRLCEEKGWKNQLPSSKSGGGVNSETPQASQSQPRTKFTQEGFLEHLVKFIVATNQVSTLLSGHFYQANFSCSRFTLLNLRNFVNSSCICAQGCKSPRRPTFRN